MNQQEFDSMFSKGDTAYVQITGEGIRTKGGLYPEVGTGLQVRKHKKKSAYGVETPKEMFPFDPLWLPLVKPLTPPRVGMPWTVPYATAQDSAM